MVIFFSFSFNYQNSNPSKLRDLVTVLVNQNNIGHQAQEIAQSTPDPLPRVGVGSGTETIVVLKDMLLIIL